MCDTQRQLKAHGTARHQFLQVLCPWCYEENTEYKRPAELKEHGKRHHPLEIRKLPNGFFSENNGFYLAVNPEDYRRVVRPSHWESEEAQEARRCILKWAQAARKPSLTMNQIEKAWELENHDGISIYSDISSFDGSRTQDMMEDFDEEYTPENPTINEPTLRSITMVPGEVNIEYNSLIDVYRVELKNTIYEDIKSTSSLMRRMSTLKTYPPLEATRTYKLTGNNLKEQLKVASRLLGIEDRHIITIKRIEQELFTSIPKPMTSITLTLPPKPLPDCITSNKENQPILKSNLPNSHSKPTQVLSSSDTHTNKPLSEKQPSRNIVTIQQRARKILEFGSMPLVPPARRNWDREEVLKLEGTTISWPPHGWKKMSSDQRKLTWEFAATTLELKTVSFNAINRTDLLDKYNCLALPGTSEDGKHSDNKIRSKVRYYNYEYLRIVANKKTTSREDKEVVEMLERAASVRNKTVDFLVHQINRYSVCLRLDDD